MTIYVGNLSYEVTKEDLESVFVEYGTIKKIPGVNFSLIKETFSLK